MLEAKLSYHAYRTSFRNITKVNQVRRVQPISCNVLVSVINIKEFKINEKDYLWDKYEEIAIDAGFILSSISRSLSKLLKYDISLYFDECTLPSSEIEWITENISHETKYEVDNDS